MMTRFTDWLSLLVHIPVFNVCLMSLEIIGLINCYLVVYMDSDMEELLLISSPETGEIPVRIVVTNATAVR